MNVVIAIDSFKGCLSSKEANEAATQGIITICHDATIYKLTISDGGEGFLDAFHNAVGGDYVKVHVCDPLARQIEAKYIIKERTAVIESAQACGMQLLNTDERNPMIASSYGLGQLIVHAVKRRPEKIIVGLGGSATSDVGIGMLRAIADEIKIHKSHDFYKLLLNTSFIIATDVKNPLYGTNGAAHVFAPQKGATPKMIELLDWKARRFSQRVAEKMKFDCALNEGAGAAGGLGYAFMQFFNAECVSGIELMLDIYKFDKLAEKTDVIITGEGTADRQTLMGKLPVGILNHAYGKPVCLIAGKVEDRNVLIDKGFYSVDCINPPNMPISQAIRKQVAKNNITATTAQLMKRFINL